VLSPISGFIIDHTPVKHLLVILCFFEGVVCIGIGLWHGRIVTIGLMALLSCFVAFSFPGYSALVPTIAGEENLTAANSTMQSVQGMPRWPNPAWAVCWWYCSVRVGRCTSTPSVSLWGPSARGFS